KANRWYGSRTTGQNVFYLHGAVHLFRGSTDGHLRKLVYERTNLLEVAATLMGLTPALHPEFIAGGEWASKLARITGKDYLEYCLSQLSSKPVTLITFGWSIQDRDLHLIDKIVNGSCKSLIIGVYGTGETSQLKAAEAYGRVAG